jgi:DNA polymerase-3 subunit delta'
MFKWNENIWKSLRRRIDRLPHAVLLQGAEGIGKLELAERLAARLLCESPTQDSEACGRCDGCRWVAAGSHPDLRRVEPDVLSQQGAAATDEVDADVRSARRAKPSSEIRVDQVRELADFLYLGSHRARRRVAIVHPAEAMNVHAANALLKGLEEPPAAAMFLLVSHHPARLLATIRSRCVVVSVPRPERSVALEWLESAMSKNDAGRWLAFSGGAPRIAEQIANGPKGELLLPYLSALARGEAEAMPEASDRETLEAMAEVVQKYVIDRLCAELGGKSLYGTVGPGSGKAVSSVLQLAGLAREMGRARALSRHPLNPRLFSAELRSRLNEVT